MSLIVNMLLEWPNSTNEPHIERVLWIDSSFTDVVTIEILNQKALPVWQKCKEIEAAIIAQEVRILSADPYAALLRPESVIPENHRKHRENVWEIISQLVESENIFNPRDRGPLVEAAVKRTGRTKTTIYSYLRRYWQAGQTKNALLPLFDKRGGKGKERKNGDVKRGRPSKLSKAIELPLGVNVDFRIKEKFRRGIKDFYKDQQGVTLIGAFDSTLREHFNIGYEIGENGKLIPVLPPENQRPTFDQFRYWYEKERDITQEKISREGQRQFNLRHRAVLGDSTQMAFGPGSIYQIDSTIGDIYLVSSLDRSRIIGRPVIYFVIDTFSRLIVGFSVSLEGPSWLSAMLALENVSANKVAFCEEYGISINEEDWPSHSLPEAILADRGELEGYNADNLVNALNIRISNTPPYRADWKGIVERNFRLSNDKMIHWMPGAVYRKRERGDRDYRLDAVLDLNHFRQLIIYCVLHHNKNHRMDWYRMDEFMIQEHVEPYPIELWNWGIRNRGGHLRQMASDIVRLNLLPTAEASVTHQGIYYKGLYYTCELALGEQWFVEARINGRWKVSIAYDIRRLDIIYLRLYDTQRLEPCQLINTQKAFQGRDWYEAIDYFAIKQQAQEMARPSQQQAKAVFHSQINSIVAEAEQQTQQALIGQSKRSRTKKIRENRKLEREHEREKDAWQLGVKEISNEPEQVIPISSSNESEEDDEGYIAPPKQIQKLRQQREKNWNNE